MKRGGASFAPEHLKAIKDVIPNRRPGIDWLLQPVIHNTPKDNFTKRLKE